MTQPRVATIGIVGLGLIGSSLALALRRSHFAGRILGSDQSEEVRRVALARQLVDAVLAPPAALIGQADLIVLAVPVLAVEGVLLAFRDQCGSPDDLPVVTDVSSVKTEIIAAARRVFGEVPAGFVPGHPIAGSERSGVGAATSDLFIGHKVILTPGAATAPAAVDLVTGMWQATGAEIAHMDPKRHDTLLAASSHLPHLLSYALVDMLAGREDSAQILEFSGGGFRDFTRIAASDPTMWHDIFRSNGESVVELLDAYVVHLHHIRRAITAGDGDFLKATFERARTTRQGLSDVRSGPLPSDDTTA